MNLMEARPQGRKSIIAWLVNCRGGDLRASMIPPETADEASAAAVG